MEVIEYRIHLKTRDVFCIIRHKTGLYSWGYYSWVGQLMASTREFYNPCDAEFDGQNLAEIPS